MTKQRLSGQLVGTIGRPSPRATQLTINARLSLTPTTVHRSFFSSYNLLEALRELNIKAGGTIQVFRFGRIDKKNTDTLPTFRDEKDLKASRRGTTDEISSADGKVALVAWYDNKIVHMGSNFIASGTPNVRRWDKIAKDYTEVEVPEIIKVYNSNM